MVRLVKDDRDFDAEARASKIYEEVRALSDADLEREAGFRAPKQQMIATIVNRRMEAE